MKDHKVNHVIDKDEFIFFVDDMMQMSIDDRKEYATRGSFQQILMDLVVTVQLMVSIHLISLQDNLLVITCSVMRSILNLRYIMVLQKM